MRSVKAGWWSKVLARISRWRRTRPRRAGPRTAASSSNSSSSGRGAPRGLRPPRRRSRPSPRRRAEGARKKGRGHSTYALSGPVLPYRAICVVLLRGDDDRNLGLADAPLSLARRDGRTRSSRRVFGGSSKGAHGRPPTLFRAEALVSRSAHLVARFVEDVAVAEAKQKRTVPRRRRRTRVEGGSGSGAPAHLPEVHREASALAVGAAPAELAAGLGGRPLPRRRG